jgi:hypothetical protein
MARAILVKEKTPNGQHKMLTTIQDDAAAVLGYRPNLEAVLYFISL